MGWDCFFSLTLPLAGMKRPATDDFETASTIEINSPEARQARVGVYDIDPKTK
jgi:hypothetical protein